MSVDTTKGFRDGPIVFQDLVSGRPISVMQVWLFCLCFLIAAIDGYDVALVGFLAPAIGKSLTLNAPQLAVLFGAGQFGSVAGALLIGPMADKFGRKRLMVMSTFGFGVMTVAAAFAPDLYWLVTLRFLTGVGLGGALPCATALTAEYCPARRRSSLTTAMFCGFTFGSAIGGFVTAWAEPQFGWRVVMCGAGVLPLLLLPLIGLAVPESVDYLLRSTGCSAQLSKILRNLGHSEYCDVDLTPHRQSAAASPVSDFFASRPIRSIALLWLTSFLTLLVVYLLSSWMPILLTTSGATLREAALATAMFQLGGTIGAVGLGVAMDRLQPNIVLSVAFFLAGVFVVFIGQVHRDLLLLPMLIFLAGAGISGGQVGVMAYAAAWFPPHVRASGVSWTSASGRFGSIVGSLAGGALLSLGLSFSVILTLLALPALLASLTIALHKADLPSSARTLSD